MKRRTKRKKQEFDTSEYFCEIRIVGSELDEEPPVMDYTWHFYSHGKEIACSARSYATARSAKRAANNFLDTINKHYSMLDIPTNFVNT